MKSLRLSGYVSKWSSLPQDFIVLLCSDFLKGPIKLGLVVASARLETLDCLLDTYVEIGEVIPGLQQYDSIFRACPAVMEVLEMYFCDVLQFHANALDVFARPGKQPRFSGDTMGILIKASFRSMERFLPFCLEDIQEQIQPHH